MCGWITPTQKIPHTLIGITPYEIHKTILGVLKEFLISFFSPRFSKTLSVLTFVKTQLGHGFTPIKPLKLIRKYEGENTTLPLIKFGLDFSQSNNKTSKRHKIPNMTLQMHKLGAIRKFYQGLFNHIKNSPLLFLSWKFWPFKYYKTDFYTLEFFIFFLFFQKINILIFIV